MKKLEHLLKIIERSSESDQLIGLSDISSQNLVGMGGYDNENGSCTGTNASCANTTCAGSSNTTCHNTSCLEEI